MSLRAAVRNRTAQVHRQDLEDALTLCKSVRRSDPGNLLRVACQIREQAEQAGLEDVLIRALLYCAEASHRLGRHDATHTHLQRADNIASAFDFPQHSLALCHAWSLHYLEIGDFRTAHEYLNRTLDLSTAMADMTAKCNALNSLGLVFARIGDYDTALRYYFEGLEIAEREQDHDTMPSVLTNIGTAYGLLGDHAKALEHYDRSLCLRTAKNDAVGIAITLKNIATVHRRQGDYQKALECFERSLEIWRSIGNSKKEANILANIGITYAEIGQLHFALSIIQHSVRYAQRAKNTLEYAFTLSKLGWVYQLLNDYDQALPAFLKSLQLFRKLRMREYEYLQHRHLAETYEASGDYRKGLEHHKQYITIREEVLGVETQRSVANMEVCRALQEAEEENRKLRAQMERIPKAGESDPKNVHELPFVQANRSGAERKSMDDVSPLPGADASKSAQDASRILRQIEEAEEVGKKQLFQEQFEQIYQEFICPLRQICPDLTPTEVRICVLIKLNFSTRQIAETLFTSPLTVKTHRTHIRRKLGVKNGQNLANLFLAI